MFRRSSCEYEFYSWITLYIHFVCVHNEDEENDLCAVQGLFSGSFQLFLKTRQKKQKITAVPKGLPCYFRKMPARPNRPRRQKRYSLDAADTRRLRMPRTVRAGTDRALTAGPDNCRRPELRWRRQRRRWSAAECACCGSLPPRKYPAFSSGIAHPNQSSRTRSNPQVP